MATEKIIQGIVGKPRHPQETQGFTEKVPLQGTVGIYQAVIILDKEA